MPPFNDDEAFSRNVGGLTRQEHHSLHRKRVAIAGLGGGGGVHLLTPSRLGTGSIIWPILMAWMHPAAGTPSLRHSSALNWPGAAARPRIRLGIDAVHGGSNSTRDVLAVVGLV